MGNFFQSVASSRPVVVNRFLDDQTDVVAFYSLRRLISIYNGPALTIRRDSDNQETDIYFNANDLLNVDAIYEFCSSGVSAYVKIWYDQSSSGLDLSQTDTTKQPQIFNGTSVTSNEGNPAVGENGAVSAPTLSNSNFTPNVQNGYSYFVACGPSGYNAPIMNFKDTAMAAETTGQATHRHAYVNNRWQSINVDTTGYPNVGQRIAGNSVIQSGHYDGSTGGEVYISRNDGYNFSGLRSDLGSPSSQIYGSGININHKAAMSELMVFNADKSSIRDTIESNINDFYGFAQLNNDLPLDTYTSSIAAWSVRKVRSAYTGSCMSVYNGTGSIDIGFNSKTNELDIASIRTHCGSNDGFVSKIYDQSGNNYDVAQSTPNNMAKIYDGASQSVIVENGKPQLQGNSESANPGGGVFYETSGNSNTYTDVYIFLVQQRSTTSSSDLNAAMAWRNGGNPGSNNSRYATQLSNGGSAGVGSNLHINGVANSSYQKNTFGSAIGAVNRIINSSHTNLTIGGNTFKLGVDSIRSTQHFQEIIIFDDDMSNDRVAIEQNQNSYFKVF